MFVHNIFIFLLVVALGSSNKKEESRDQNKYYDSPFLMYNVLQSVLKLNEARYETLKNLNKLNSVHYLRTSNENGNDFKHIWDKLKSIFNLITIKPNLEKNDPNVDYYDVFYENNYVLTIPIPSNGHNSLRTGSEESLSDEDKKMIEDVLSDENKTNKDNLRDYICGKGALRCYLACKEAYRISCYLKFCEDEFRIEMRRSCRDECEDRFY